MLTVNISAANPAEIGTPLLASRWVENPRWAESRRSTLRCRSLTRTIEMKDFRGAPTRCCISTASQKGRAG